MLINSSKPQLLLTTASVARFLQPGVLLTHASSENTFDKNTEPITHASYSLGTYFWICFLMVEITATYIKLAKNLNNQISCEAYINSRLVATK